MAIEWADSANKHGVPHEDALHALLHADLHVSGFGPSRDFGGFAPDGWIGPARSGEALEVFAVVGNDFRLFIFHVMPLRETTRVRLNRILEERDNHER